MSLSTAVTPSNIATELARLEPTGATAEQWQVWINDALLLIDDRAAAEGVTPAQTKLDYVIRQAVVAQVKKPDDATQITVAVDDGSTSRRYESGSGRVTILDEWWTFLGIGLRASGAFSIDLIPSTSPFYVSPS
ncbi:hypothetical protein CQ047_17850 [Microbacterium sp. MYb72]|uniref:hypothetical protein n=1 Tax=Microbacterium sp. MYb72 TaxID=1848693 RepID=UPI000CFDADB3|nr:hypothetical protein [Microbacterium sp. MYb72]PRB02768.1 hypothetical protein CQ047_17850 [Microbacterium sp. MYb72]